jgi:hypothetical protein
LSNWETQRFANWVHFRPHLKTEADIASETLCSVLYNADDGQVEKPSDPMGCTASSDQCVVRER